MIFAKELLALQFLQKRQGKQGDFIWFEIQPKVPASQLL
jgi:hypothetical protein